MVRSIVGWAAVKRKLQGADRDVVKVWQQMNAKRFDNFMLNTKTVGAKAA